MLILSALVALGLPASSAAAQNAPGQPVSLTGVRLISDTPGESRFALTFSPRAVPFGTAVGPPDQPGLGFGLASRAPSATLPPGLKGLVRRITFEQRDVILLIHFEAKGAATLSAVQTDPRTVEVTVRSGTAAAEASDLSGPAAVANPPPVYETPQNYELVMLKYADVSEVVGLLTDGQTVRSNDVFIPNEPAFGSNSLTGNGYQPQIQAQAQAPGSSDEPLGQSVDPSISIDRRLNAVLLKGTPERIATLKAIIAAVDIPLDSVILETQMVELTESGQKALGIDFANAAGQIGVVNVSSGAFNPVGVTQGCNGDLVNCSGHVTSAQFQAALYAQIQKGNGRIISTPRIAAQSGSTAKIITGDALPILTSIALSGVNGVSQQVQYVNVGVTLQIAPRVSGDGFVSSHVFVVVSSVTGFSQGYPTISQREAQTSATVRDGDSFVIGGLTQDANISTKTKVPLLGDLPLVGQAFRSDRYTKARTELYIIVAPHIVHHVGARTVPANAPVYAPTTTTIRSQ